MLLAGISRRLSPPEKHRGTALLQWRFEQGALDSVQ
jgi:hypothetical protein